MNLTDKVAFITGATSGIGEATAHLMASRGAKIIVGGLYRHEADKTAADIRARGFDAIGVAGDVADEDAVRTMVAQGADAYGAIDILHANAGLTTPDHTSRDGLISEMNVDVWDRTMAVNVRGVMLCCKHVIPHMLRAGGGSVIMTSSGRGVQGDFALPAYGTSKGALITLGRYVAAQYGKQNIRCNVLVLGLIMTPATTATFSDEVTDLLKEHHLTPFLGTPRDVAEVTAFLASDAARFMTGHTIEVDGGFASHAPTLADMLRTIPRPALE